MDDLKQTLTPDSFTRQEELIFADCDAGKRARLGTLLSLCAAVSEHDFDARGLPHEKMLSLGQALLLSRVALRIPRRPEVREVVNVTTWENGSRGAHIRRNFEMTDSRGAVCLSGKSEWILIDPTARKILRPAAFTAKKLTLCPREIDCPECKKVALPREGLEDLGSRPVRYSDLDGNGHVYSGNYGDIFWDALPPDLQTREPREFFINYCREATLGETLLLSGFREGGAYRMEGRAGEETCFACECVF